MLEAVPGIHVIPSTLNRLSPVFSVRGLYTGQNPQILFMLNGNRIIGDLFGGGITHMAKLNVTSISRIEVVRGPGSALYGADAFSGVINIISKSAQELNGFHSGLRFGAHNTQNIWGQLGRMIGHDWELALNLEFLSRDSDDSRTIYSDSQSMFDGLFGSSASLAPGHIEDRFEATSYNIHLNNRNWKFGLDGYVKRDSGLGVGAAQALDKEGRDDYDQYLFTIGYKNKEWLNNWQFEGLFSYHYSKIKPEFNIFPAGTILPIGDDGNIFTSHNGSGCLTMNISGIGCLTTFKDGLIGNPGGISKIPTLQATALYQGLKHHQFQVNIGIKNEDYEAFSTKNFGPGVLDNETLGGASNPIEVDGSLSSVTNTPYIYAPDVNRTVKYASLQDIWDINANWTLTTGVRYDDYSDFGSTVNPRVALVWTATDSFIAKLLYGEAFRAPNFSELQAKNNPVIIGNDDLEPETIKTTELVLNYKVTANFTTGLNIYHYKAKDMIEFLTSPDGSKTAQNDRNLTGLGFEFEIAWSLNKQWSVKANYTYQSTKDGRTDKQIEYVPKKQFYLDARWKLNPNWELTSQLNWIGDRKRAEGDSRDEIDDYTLVNLTLRRSNIAKHWEVAASVKNLFNEDIREPSDGLIPDDYPMNERSAFVELSYRY